MKPVNTIIKSSYKSLNGDLYKEYEESLKDEKFKRLVDILNVDSKILMKYTSSLEESAAEYNNCMHCKSLLTCKNKVCGFAYLPKVNGNILTFNYVACKKKQKLDKENSFSKNVHLYDLPMETLNASFSDIYLEYKERFEVITWLKDFIKNYDKNKKSKGLYLHGNFGCGKTYLIAAIFNELAHDGYKSSIVFWPEFLRQAFYDDFNEKFEYVKKVPLLLIDDIGAEGLTAWNRDEILCPLLQYRMDNHLTTFFTSNLSLKELESHLSNSKQGVDLVKARRIISRIEQLTESKEMISKNLRK